MESLFVDTAGWMACADAADASHALAAEARNRALTDGARLVTTDFVIDETLTLIRMRLGMPAAEAWWQQISESRLLRWERIDAARFEAGRALFFRYSDKDFSLTDCTSFAVMRELRIADALTTDHHFEQMGFRVVPAAGRRATRKPRRQRDRE